MTTWAQSFVPSLRTRQLSDSKRPADDFSGRVALDAFAARIPTDDHAIRIEHVDRVVGNSADQKCELASIVDQVGALQLNRWRLLGGSNHKGAFGIARETHRVSNPTLPSGKVAIHSV